MILKDENRSLKEKLQKAYDFMKQFTINDLNMLEHFLGLLVRGYRVFRRISVLVEGGGRCS